MTTTLQEKKVYEWGHGRRFNAYSNYFRSIYGTRVQKVSIDAGFSCPNRDGTKGSGGCTYCNNDAFNPSYCCLLYTSDAADEEDSVDLGGRRIIKKKKTLQQGHRPPAPRRGLSRPRPGPLDT